MELTLNSIGEFIKSLITWGIWGLIGLIIIIGLGVTLYLVLRKKKWNLKVEVKIPRSDGLLINREKAKGHYDVKKGLVSIKRKGVKASEMKPFDVKEYLQGTNFLETIQIGPDDYIPSLPRSYNKLKVKNKDGISEVALMDIYTDLGERKQWAFYSSKNAKNRFTLAGFLEKYKWAIETAIILFAIFIGFAALWSKVG